MTVRPIDDTRAARFVIASMEGDSDKALQAFNEAANEGTVPDLMFALTGQTIGFLRIAAKGNNEVVKQLFMDVILKAQPVEEA